MGERVKVIENYFILVRAFVTRLDTLDVSLLVKVLLNENVLSVDPAKVGTEEDLVSDQNSEDA